MWQGLPGSPVMYQVPSRFRWALAHRWQGVLHPKSRQMAVSGARALVQFIFSCALLVVAPVAVRHA